MLERFWKQPVYLNVKTRLLEPYPKTQNAQNKNGLEYTNPFGGRVATTPKEYFQSVERAP
jgi:hypothetical protein